MERGRGCFALSQRLQQLRSGYQLGTPWVTLANSLQLVSISNGSSRDNDTPNSLFYTLRLKLFRKSNVLHSTACQFYL